jgi:hypothetical protein
MTYTRVSEDEHGVSFFEDNAVALEDQGAIGRISQPIPVASLMLRETPAEDDIDWRPTPRRPFIVLLVGEIEITTGSGESRRFQGGDVLLVEDTTGKGHVTRHVRKTVRRSLFISLPEQGMAR